jgi:3-dehydro-4-phosphotetronate decarboxylase
MSAVLTESEARDEICRIGASLFARGYVHATAGNISVRLDDAHGGGFLITPTDACLGFLDPARLARLDAHGQQIGGDPASKTITLHRQIYQAAANTPTPAGSIIHTHSTHCVALSLKPAPDAPSDLLLHELISRELLPALTPYFVMKVGHVPVIPYCRPGDPAAADAVAATIQTYGAAGKPIRAVMLERLGPNVWHGSPAAAMAVLEELEETAKLWLLNDGSAMSLDEVALAELRQVFAAHW